MSEALPDPMGPALLPPDGVEPDFVNHVNGNTMVTAIVTVCLALSTFFLGIRAYAKGIYVKKLGIADIIIIPAFALYVTFCAFLYQTCTVSGWFVHQWDIRLIELSNFFYMLFLATQMYLATMIFLKSAILVEWAQIFSPGSKGSFYWTCYGVAGLNALYYLINIILENTAYTPREFYWDKSIPDGKMNFDASKLALSSAIINLIFDLVVLVLPIRKIWGLNMKLKKKAGCTLVFIVGLIAVASALARLITSTAYISSGDYTYELSPAAMLCLAEMTAGMLVFATPASPKPLAFMAASAGHSLERLLTSRGSGSRSRTTGAAVESSASGLYGRRNSSSKNSLPRTYENIDKQGHVALRTYKSRESARSAGSERQNESVPDVSSTGIVRTTDFTISPSRVEDGKVYDTTHP